MTDPVHTGTAALLAAFDIWSTGPSAAPVEAKAPAAPPPAAVITEAKLPEAPVQPARLESLPTEAKSEAKSSVAKSSETKSPETESPETKSSEAKWPAPAEVPAPGARRISLSARLAAAGPAASYRQYGVQQPYAWPPRKLSLALQGGGAFGAFTWGVLDRLLDEDGCDLDAISGASAGAINAVLLACGLVEGGRHGAQSRLSRFWTRMTNDASFRALMLIGGFSPAGSSVAFGPALRLGHLDPFDLDPLRQVLAQEIDFSALRAPNCPKLLIAATRVRDGKLQIFRNSDITTDVVLASTCPPLVHCAVEIAGESYWDGGFAANPPVVRLAHESDTTDLLVVQVTPVRERYIPMTMAAIDRRLDQIMANSILNAEIAALELVRNGTSTPLRVFKIAAEDEIDGLAQRSPVDLGRSFVEMLHRSGRAAAERWLKQDQEQRPAAIAEKPSEVSGREVRSTVRETVEA